MCQWLLSLLVFTPVVASAVLTSVCWAAGTVVQVDWDAMLKQYVPGIGQNGATSCLTGVPVLCLRVQQRELIRHAGCRSIVRAPHDKGCWRWRAVSDGECASVHHSWRGLYWLQPIAPHGRLVPAADPGPLAARDHGSTFAALLTHAVRGCTRVRGVPLCSKTAWRVATRAMFCGLSRIWWAP